MKKRQLSVIEIHIEKIVFAIASIALLALVSLQFLSPITVEVNNQTVAIENAADEVVDAAVLLDGQLKQAESIEVPEAEDNGGMVKAMSPEIDVDPAGLAIAWEGIDVGDDPTETQEDIDLGPQERYAEITVPALRNVVAGVFEGALSPSAVTEYSEQLEAIVGTQQPFDVRGVSVSADFPVAELRDSLTNPPAGTPIRQTWYQGRMEILDVELYRQRQNEDGTWSDAELVNAVPGAPSLREQLIDGLDDRRAQDRLIQQMGNTRGAIRQPPMLPFVAGEPWAEPQMLAARATGDREIQKDDLVSQIREITRDIDRRESRLERLRDGGRDNRNSDGIQRQIDEIQEQIADLEAERSELVEELRDLGYEIDLESGQFETRRVRENQREGSNRNRGDAGPLLEAREDTVMVWAHDIEAELGHTYRYQLRVSLVNPYFDQARLLMDEQKPLANDATIVSPPSEWSDPIVLLPHEVFMVRQAKAEASALPTDRDLLSSRAQANFDLYRFHYGYWRKGAISLDVGDALAGEISVPELPIFSVDDPNAQNRRGEDEEEMTSDTLMVTSELHLIDVVRRSADVNEVVLAASSGRLEIRLPNDPA
ncbi:MAG: hypothetical protein AAGB34_10520, partial [Planctomycetota bacterium]